MTKLFAKFSIFQSEESRKSDILKALRDNKEVLEQYKFVECKGTEKSRIGFSQTPFNGGEYVSEVNGNLLLRIMTQGKSPNRHEINAVHKLRQHTWCEENKEEVVPSKIDKLLKEDAEQYVLSTTFPQEPKEHYVVFRPDGLVLVNGSGKAAEDVLALIRKALGSLPVFPFYPEEADVNVMLKQRALDKIKDRFDLGDEAEITDVSGTVHKVKGDLYDATEVTELLKEERAVVSKVGITYDTVIDTVLTEDLVFEKVKYDKGLTESEEDLGAGIIIQLNETNKMVDETLKLLETKKEEV